MKTLPIFELSGTPYEIGRLHGSLCKKQVEASLTYYRLAFEEKMDWKKAKCLARTYESDVRGFDLEIYAEMQGIADGAGVDICDILALNCRSEFTRMDISEKLALLSGGCTALAVLPQRTQDGKLYHGQTWDFAKMQREAIVILKIRQAGKPDILMITEGGLVGGKGMNSCGVSMTLNALRTTGDPSGVPLHVLMRGMLNARSVSDAGKLAANTRCSGAACLMVAQKDCALALELVPGDFDVFYPVDGALIHTNHILSQRFSGIKDLARKQVFNSFLRLGRCQTLLQGQTEVTLDKIKEIFADHAGMPGSICIHPDETAAEHQQYATNYAVIFDLTEKIVHFCFGNPCCGEYTEIKLN